MSISRRDFIKLFGITVASLSITRCRRLSLRTCYSPTLTPSPIVVPTTTCYLPTATPSPTSSTSAREQLREFWLGFDTVAYEAQHGADQEGNNKDYLETIQKTHQQALDELVSSGELKTSVADLIQEAYEAALFHVWRMNKGATCYVMAFTYSPTSAEILVRQSEELSRLAVDGTIDPDTLAKAQAALEHDMAFYALTEEETNALYDQIEKDLQHAPGFEELDLEITDDARAAAKFIIELLTQHRTQ